MFIVLAATILMGVVLAVAIWRPSPASSRDFLNSGKKYFEQEKYPEAVVQFLNAVQKDARNRDARYFLALSYLRQGNLNGAAQQLNALLEYYPDDVDANLQLGSILLIAGRSDATFFRQASEIAKKVLSKEPEKVSALILAGNASAGLQNYQSSVEQFEKAVSLDPQNASAFVSLGTTQTLQKNYPEAEQAFLKAREVSPKDKTALISLTNYYLAVREFDKAEAVFKEAFSQYPTDRIIYIQFAEFYYQMKRFDEAEKLLRDVQSKDDKDPSPSLALVDLYQSTNRSPQARNLLFEIKKTFPENLTVATKIALSLIQSEPERAKSEIDQILKAEPKSPVGHILLGELQFLSGQFDAAASTFEKDPAINSPYPQAHFFLGNLATRKGLTDEAIHHYQKSLEINGSYVPARLALADTFLKQGQVASSREEIAKLLTTQASNLMPVRLLKAALDREEKNYAAAEKELTALAKEEPGNAAVQRQLALYYESRGQTGDAEKSMARALELQPNSEETLRDLVRLYVKEKQIDRALQKINTVPDEKKQAFHYELIGMVYMQAGKPEEAEKAYRKALEKDPNRTSTDVYLAAQYIQTGRLNEGLERLDELIKKNPANASAYGAKALIYQRQGKVDDAKQSYSQALKVDPNFESAANNLAYILAEEGRDLETALNWAQMARKKEPNNPSIADTLGWVYYKLGNHILARDQLLFAVSKLPENAVFQYHLAMIYKETKQYNEAQAALKKVIASPQEFKEKSLAQAALRQLTATR
jgi:tetratricopeptide (TPR) repeat protein